jgi:hypothetical protein
MIRRIAWLFPRDQYGLIVTIDKTTTPLVGELKENEREFSWAGAKTSTVRSRVRELQRRHRHGRHPFRRGDRHDIDDADRVHARPHVVEVTRAQRTGEKHACAL